MRRLYLTHHCHYRVRCLNGTVIRCVWDDAAMLFRPTAAQRNTPRRSGVIPLDRVGAVSPRAFEGKARAVWYPLDQCYREIHRPEPTTVWVHPYAARAA